MPAGQRIEESKSTVRSEKMSSGSEEDSEIEAIERERQKILEKKRAREKRQKKKDNENLRINEVILCMGYPEASGVEIVAAHIGKRMRIPVVDVFGIQKSVIKTKEPPELYEEIKKYSAVVHKKIKMDEENDKRKRMRAEENMRRSRLQEAKRLLAMEKEKERDERMEEKRQWRDLKEKRDVQKLSEAEAEKQFMKFKRKQYKELKTGMSHADGSEGSNLSDSSHSELMEELDTYDWPWDDKESYDPKSIKAPWIGGGGVVEPIPVLEIPAALQMRLLMAEMMEPGSLMAGRTPKPRQDFNFGFVCLAMPTRLDGAERLAEMLSNIFAGGAVTRVLECRCADAVLVHRLTGNWVHRNSGRRYNLHVRPPKSHLQQRKAEIEARLVRLASGEKMIDIKREEDSELVYIDGIRMPKDPSPQYMKDDFTGDQLDRIIVDPYTAIKQVQRYRKMLDKGMNYYSSMGKQNKLKIAYMLIDGNTKAERLPEATDNNLKQDTSIILPDEGLDGEALFDERKSTWTNPYAITKIRQPNGLSVENKNRVKGKHITVYSEAGNDLETREEGEGSSSRPQKSERPGIFACLCGGGGIRTKKEISASESNTDNGTSVDDEIKL